MNDTDAPPKNCATCRHSTTNKRRKILEATGMDDQLMWADADEDETVYSCLARIGPHAQKEVGILPVLCDSWDAPVKTGNARLAELDELLARRERRL